MSYVLEAKTEFERLEKQSRHPNYDFKKELAGFEIAKNAVVLDAGCGSGIVARFIAEQHPTRKVVGCDLSEDRVKLASHAAAHLKNVQFQTERLEKFSFRDDFFDTIICRYVLQHLTPALAGKVLTEFHRVLKPGGKLCLIDTDGLLINIHPQTKAMKTALKKLAQVGPVDLFMGRKLPGLVLKAGLAQVALKIESLESAVTEADLVRERFEHAFPALSKTLGGDEPAKAFVKDYLETMTTAGTVAYFNKIIVTGQKTLKRRLTVVK